MRALTGPPAPQHAPLRGGLHWPGHDPRTITGKHRRLGCLAHLAARLLGGRRAGGRRRRSKGRKGSSHPWRRAARIAASSRRGQAIAASVVVQGEARRIAHRRCCWRCACSTRVSVCAATGSRATTLMSSSAARVRLDQGAKLQRGPVSTVGQQRAMHAGASRATVRGCSRMAGDRATRQRSAVQRASLPGLPAPRPSRSRSRLLAQPLRRLF